MAVAVQDIAQWLDDRGWEYLTVEDADQTRFVLSLECSGALTLSLEVSVAEEGQFVQLRVAELIPGRTLETTPYRRRILSAAAEETFRRRLAKIGFDPQDGEIDCCVDLPLEDCTLTQRQFEYAFHLVILVARLVHARMAVILETGRDPGPLNVEDLPKHQ